MQALEKDGKTLRYKKGIYMRSINAIHVGHVVTIVFVVVAPWLSRLTVGFVVWAICRSSEVYYW